MEFWDTFLLFAWTVDAPKCTGQQADTARAGLGLLGRAAGPRSRPHLGSLQGFANMDATRADTTFDAGRRRATPPLGLTLAQRGGRCHSREGGWKALWEGPNWVTRGLFQEERTQVKAQGTQIHRLLGGHTQVYAPCKLPSGLYRVNGHPSSATSSSPNLETSRGPLSSFCKPRWSSTR